MKKFCFAVAALLAVSTLVISGCSKSSPIDSQSHDEEMPEVSKILYLLNQEGITSPEDGIEYMANICGSALPITKGAAGYGYEDYCYENISMEAATIIANFKKVVVSEDDTEESVKDCFYSILDNGGLDKNSDEYINLKLAVDTSFELFEYLVENNQPHTKASKFWQTVGAIAKCVGGTVGSAGLGALAGAGAGTITLPIIGTVSGTAVGAVSGGLVGAAEFC